MSRIGNNPITVPAGVEITIADNVVTVKGSKGELNTTVLDGISVKHEGDTVVVSRSNEEKKTKAAHGLVRSLIQNNITGVTNGFSKQLEVNGVGFKANVSGKALKLSLGFSHDITFTAPDDIEVKVSVSSIPAAGSDMWAGAMTQLFTPHEDNCDPLTEAFAAMTEDGRGFCVEIDERSAQ